MNEILALQNILPVFFYNVTEFLFGCNYPTITQATLQVHLVQPCFSKIVKGLHFGHAVAKMAAKFDKYYLPIPILHILLAR